MRNTASKRLYWSIVVALSLSALSQISDADTDGDRQAAKLIIYRTGSIYGAAYDNLVYLDGRPVGILGLSAYIELDLLPGVHHMWVTSPASIPRFESIEIQAGETIYAEAIPHGPSITASRGSDNLVAKVHSYDRKEPARFSPPRLFVFPDAALE